MQLTEQSLGLLQIERVEALGEPAIDRSEKIAGLERAIWEPMASECVYCIAGVLCVSFST